MDYLGRRPAAGGGPLPGLSRRRGAGIRASGSGGIISPRANATHPGATCRERPGCRLLRRGGLPHGHGRWLRQHVGAHRSLHRKAEQPGLRPGRRPGRRPADAGRHGQRHDLPEFQWRRVLDPSAEELWSRGRGPVLRPCPTRHGPRRNAWRRHLAQRRCRAELAATAGQRGEDCEGLCVSERCRPGGQRRGRHAQS